MKKQFDQDPVKRYVDELAAACYGELSGSVEEFIRHLVRTDLDRMTSERWKKFRRRPYAIKWENWKREDVKRRLFDRMKRLADDPHIARRVFSGASPAGFIEIGAKRVLRTVTSAGALAGIAQVVVGAVAPQYAPIVTTIAGLLGPGVEKIGREILRSKSGDESYGWIALVRDIWLSISKFLSSRRRRGGER